MPSINNTKKDLIDNKLQDINTYVHSRIKKYPLLYSFERKDKREGMISTHPFIFEKKTLRDL